MPRGRKRKITAFVPQPWIHNTSSEDEDGPHELLQPEPQQPNPCHGEGNYTLLLYMIS